jgi:hypothetical protein
MAQNLATIGFTLAGSALLAAASSAQGPATAGVTDGAANKATFAAPVRLMAGDKLMGEARLYPSPVFHDVNGDGRQDLVIGDLRGLMTVALRLPSDGPARFDAESPLENKDGKPLKFSNW